MPAVAKLPRECIAEELAPSLPRLARRAIGGSEESGTQVRAGGGHGHLVGVFGPTHLCTRSGVQPASLGVHGRPPGRPSRRCSACNH